MQKIVQGAFLLYPICKATSLSNFVFLCVLEIINALPNDNFLDWSRLKAFADDKLYLTQNIKVVFHRIENIVGKEENAGYQHFLLFPQCFQKAFKFTVSKVVIVW